MKLHVLPFRLTIVEENLEKLLYFPPDKSFKTFKGVSLRVKSPPTLQHRDFFVVLDDFQN